MIKARHYDTAPPPFTLREMRIELLRGCHFSVSIVRHMQLLTIPCNFLFSGFSH